MAYIGVQPADAYTSFAVQHFTTSATTSYTLDNSVANENEIALFINNVRQEPGSSYAYTASGTTLTLSAATSASDTMYCVFIGKAVQTVTPTLPIANFSSTGIDDNADATAITIDSSENVGIGTTSPNGILELKSTGNTNFFITAGTTSASQVVLGDTDDIDVGKIAYSHNGNQMEFTVNASERMRIDSSGNVLVGKTDTTRATAGAEVRANGFIRGTRDQGHAFDAVRTGNDGPSIKVYRDNSDAGSIGNFGTTNMVMGSGICGIRYNGSNLTPFHITNYANTDDTLSLGHPSIRWDNVYATNGTIQTSDQNEKQSIQLLTTTEIAVAKRISKLFKTFKFNSAVEEKGDNARIHTGIIAQDVKQAFTDEGLDASNYGLFTSDTWWEKEISVDAVAEELDENGDVLVEGKDAYTYLDTKEEATEGYTEKTRLGIRYPELLSFVSSAFEQRLTDIETRIATLENA